MLLSGGLLYYVADTTIILHTGSKSEIFLTLSTCVELVVFSKFKKKRITKSKTGAKFIILQ